MPKWVEGIDYSIEKTQEGLEKVVCLHCGRQLSSKSGLGPHLTSCTSRKEAEKGTTPAPREAEFDLDEKENFIDTLQQFRVKNPEGLAAFVSGFGFDNLDVIDEALRLSDVDIGKRQLIVTRWAHHTQKSITPTLLQRWTQPQQVFQPQQAGNQAQALTEERLLQILNERDRKRQEEDRLRQLEATVLRLQTGEGNPSRKSEIQELKEFILTQQKDELLTRIANVERNITTTNDPIVQVIKSTENILREIRGDLKPIKWWLVTGKIPGEPLPEKEIQPGASSLYNRINPKYVSEE